MEEMEEKMKYRIPLLDLWLAGSFVTYFFNSYHFVELYQNLNKFKNNYCIYIFNYFIKFKQFGFQRFKNNWYLNRMYL